MRTTLRTAALLLLSPISLPDAIAASEPRALTVYRCGAAANEWRSTPCPAGPSASHELSYHQPSAEQTLEAARRSQEQRRLADRMTREREQAEALALRENAAPTVMHGRRPAARSSEAAADSKPFTAHSRPARHPQRKASQTGKARH